MGSVPGMRCGMCGSQRLSPVGELTTDSMATERMRLRFPRPGRFKSRPTFTVTFARACRDCGTLYPCLGEYERMQLDATADGLAE